MSIVTEGGMLGSSRASGTYTLERKRLTINTRNDDGGESADIYDIRRLDENCIEVEGPYGVEQFSME